MDHHDDFLAEVDVCIAHPTAHLAAGQSQLELSLEGGFDHPISVGGEACSQRPLFA
ncbi:MAG: hypothetical protein AB7S26_20425 [Sandaracinaceae bacterium]